MIAGIVAVLLAFTAAPVASTEATSTHYTGSLADGGTWIADVPAAWNGTLVLYSHGFGTLSPADAPGTATQQELLDLGYALVGSSYDPNGSLWALDSAVRDQFASLAAIRRIIGRPRMTLALGTSMGGLVSAQEAQTVHIDGALTTCGLLGGGIDLNNYQLDGEYALSRLLGVDVPLVSYPSQADGAAAAAQLSAAATSAQSTAAGRARVALGTALLNMPTWSNQQAEPPAGHDAAGLAKAQYDWSVATLPFIMSGRYYIELSAGGNASWNAGVDYSRLIARSPYREMVVALYREAGLDLRADLSTLTRHASVRADPAAVAELARTSTVSGRLAVPELTLHTLYDQLAPVEYENRYAEQVRAAGDSRLLRQAYVARRGHCAFSTVELVAGLRAVERRVATGHWGRELGPFVDFHPGPLVSHRQSTATLSSRR